MITEKDVEKLGKITDTDIESVQATQSPKNAKAGYVLTAVSGGTAEYKPAAASGSKIHAAGASIPRSEAIRTDETGTYLSVQLSYSNVIAAFLDWNSLKITGTGETAIDQSLVSVVVYPSSSGGWDNIRVYLAPEAISRYSITEATRFKGGFRIYYYA